MHHGTNCSHQKDVFKNPRGDSRMERFDCLHSCRVEELENFVVVVVVVEEAGHYLVLQPLHTVYFGFLCHYISLH